MSKRGRKPYYRLTYFHIIGISLVIFGLGVLLGINLNNRSLKESSAPTFTKIINLPTDSNITPTLSVSPQPSYQQSPTVKPLNWQTYSDSQGGFSIQYPQNYKLNTQKPGVMANFLSCVNQSDNNQVCLTGFGVTIYTNYSGGSRREWFKQNRGSFFIDPYYENMTVGGVNALIVMDGNAGGSTSSVILIPRGTRMYVVDFPSGWNPDTGDKPGLEFIKQVASTFKLQ